VFDHIGLSVGDFARSLRFYRAALEPLGLGVEFLDEKGESAGLGPAGAPQLWLGKGPGARTGHVAFRARNRDAVQKFHRAALAAGGRDNGAPGLRPDYHANYYAAFVLDPDGNNVEAVCHDPA
jgi:catechol 2,3-dioxygenase-like lactoylglutathione lyase family enzyme